MDPYNHLRSYGEALIDSVDPVRAEAVAVRALAAPSAGLSLRRRLVAIAAASATFITGNLGVAMAADSAVPGDLLYGIDRAYEKLSELIGLSDDHTDERLAEAAQLADSGRSVDALDAVVEQIQSLQRDPGPDSAELGTAADAVAEARDRALVVPENITAAISTEHAKEIVGIAHDIADAIQAGDRDEVRRLIALLRDAASEKNNGNAFGRDENKGQGQPPVDPGNGGDRGNSGEAPKP